MAARKRFCGVPRLLGVAMVATFVGLPLWTWTALPQHLRMVRDQAQELDLHVPLPLQVRSNQADILRVNGRSPEYVGMDFSLANTLQMIAVTPGQANLDFRLFGLIPFRRMSVEVFPPLRLIPGGHSIGVLMRSSGVMIVGHAPVRDGEGRTVFPARDAGLDAGDLILRVNGVNVANEEHLGRLIERAGQLGLPVRVGFRRKGAEMEKVVWPVNDAQARTHRVGLYVRDGAAGVGTLTFIDPSSGRYGALGHVITDSDTGDAVPVRDGHIVKAAVSAIDKGSPGAPGEKIGVFVDEDHWIGNIEQNTRYGIFGSVAESLPNPVYPEALPVAMSGQVREGPAEILTVVSGQKVEKFGIQILRSTRNPGADGRHMVIKITDPRLLSQTRGIVQGMSGSPIIQNGQLVGAVTHVFVNDPARGYGVFMEWMLQEAGLLQETGKVGSGVTSRGPAFRLARFEKTN